ncbi:MAG: EF-hand domain-containing protein [Planctomycetaceae bacterium]|nr:EF-hand domain-containing protein [Planctomycetaceae bacterium]
MIGRRQSLIVVAALMGNVSRAEEPSAVPAKVVRYADAVFRRCDLDGDGRLTETEWRSIGVDHATIDLDQDGIISREEFLEYVLRFGRARSPVYSSETLNEPAAAPSSTADGADASSAIEVNSAPEDVDASTNAAGKEGVAGTEGKDATPRTTRYAVRASRGLGKLPGWFLARDADGDGQLTLREFAGEAGGNSREFERLDRNRDGVITPHELTAPREDGAPR